VHPELAICPLHLFFFLESTNNVETGFNIERASLPLPSYELTGVAGTVGGGRLGSFHGKYSFGTFYEHLVGQNKFAKEGKFLNFELVGNGRKGKRNRLNAKEMNEKDKKLRK